MPQGYDPVLCTVQMHALTLSHIIPASPISAVLLQSLFLLPPLPSPSKTRVCCVVCRARGSREVHPPSCLICRREWQYPAYNGLVAGTTMRKQHFFFVVTTLAASLVDISVLHGLMVTITIYCVSVHCLSLCLSQFHVQASDRSLLVL